MLCRPNALANSPAPARKPSNQLEAPRTLGEIPGTPESHAQNLAHFLSGLHFLFQKALQKKVRFFCQAFFVKLFLSG